MLRTFYADPTGPASFIGGMTAPEEVAFIMGWGAALSAAIGVIAGGVIADLWRRYDPRGRVFVNMASVILAAPLTWLIFSTESLATFYWVFPIAHMFGAMWVGAAVATLQDLVLPRMRATAGATYILGTTMVGLALGPYFAGKVADIAGSLRIGIFALYLIVPFTLAGLWWGSRRLGELEASAVDRARAAGEAV